MELKPCKWCSGTPSFYQYEDRYDISCINLDCDYNPSINLYADNLTVACGLWNSAMENDDD